MYQTPCLCSVGFFNRSDKSSDTACRDEGCSVEVAGHQVDVLFLHYGADSEEKLLAGASLLGVGIIDVQRDHSEER